VRDTFWPVPLAAAALAAGLVACGDDPVRPDELFEFVEAEAVVRSATALPSLTEIIAGTATTEPAQTAAFDLALQLWSMGASTDDLHGAVRRQAAVAYAAPILADLRPAEDWQPVRERTERWISSAHSMLRHLDLPNVETRLVAARRHLDRADAATSHDGRVYHILLAISDLVETTPRSVARGLVVSASAAVDRVPATASAADVERARRLADWAARALEEGDEIRAIQRAYYAIQLAEGL
jgi:hypothetical protein